MAQICDVVPSPAPPEFVVFQLPSCYLEHTIVIAARIIWKALTEQRHILESPQSIT
jgi:hypothetical protein